MNSNKGSIFIISGPSGCGKNTVFDALMKKDCNIEQTVSVTTRAPRAGERDGVDYYFVSKDEFNSKINSDEFIEYVNYGDNFYGTLKSEVRRILSEGKNVVLVIEVTGAGNIKKAFPEAVSIFILPPSLDELRNRIVSRGENTPEETATRLKIAAEELRFKDDYDYRVINDKLDECVENIYTIINEQEK